MPMGKQTDKKIARVVCPPQLAFAAFRYSGSLRGTHFRNERVNYLIDLSHVSIAPIRPNCSSPKKKPYN